MSITTEYPIISLRELNLIGISGNAGVGKDTVTNYIANKYIEVYREAFADPLKQICAHAFGMDLEDFYEPSIKETQHPFWRVSPRQIAQFVGTELFRHHLTALVDIGYGNFWIKRLEGKLTGASRYKGTDGLYTPGDTIIIPDVRFQNEYDWIVDNGGYVFSIQRDGYDGTVGLKNHASEAGFESWNSPKTYRIFNNSTLEDLYNEVDKAITYFGLQNKLVPVKFNLNDF